jgi:putative membrane protein
MSPVFENIHDFLFRKENGVKIFLAIFFIVGLFGFAIPSTGELFKLLTPFILLLNFIVLILFHSRGFDNKTMLIFFLIYLISFSIEIAGVNTGIIFGSYTYGKGLGLKIFRTPFMIGINWIFLVYCTNAVFERIPVNNILRIIGASLLMVLYDLILEQAAPLMDMWFFEGGFAPFRNYLSWLMLALIFHTLIKIAGIRIINKIAPFVFWCQGAFFLLLIIFTKLAG